MNKRLDIKPPQFSSMDVFCGGGGASLGIHGAGFTGALAIDVNSKALECFQANNPGVPILHKPVQYVAAKEVFKITGLEKGELDHMHGSPPCQLFSTANTKAAANPPEHTNENFYHYIRLIDELKPKTFTAENVDGMMMGSKIKYFNDIIKRLQSLNEYEFKYKAMNAAFYGVPQDRKRVIFIGKRRDVAPNDSISFPKPNKEGTKFLTVRMVAPHIQQYDPRQFNQPGKDNSNLMCTIKASNSIAVCVNNKWRAMTIPEAKLFMGFPESYVMPSKSRYVNIRVLGNAVPPPMMYAVMCSVKQLLLSAQQGKSDYVNKSKNL